MRASRFHASLRKHFFLLPLFASCAFGATIDSTRLPPTGSWENSGVAGGIPNRTIIFQTLIGGATEAQIQAAINSCPSGQVVKLGAGTFTITNGLVMKAGVTLRGSGSSTILQYDGTSGVGLVGAPGGSVYNKVAITSSVTKGSSSFTTNSTAGLSAGSYVAISHTNPSDVTARSYGGTNSNVATWVANSNPNAAMVQVVKVTSVSGNTVSFTPAVYVDMPNNPQYQMLLMTTGMGIEDLVAAKTQTTGGGTSIWMSGAAESWIRGVVIKWPQATGILFQNAFGCTVQNCTIDSTNFAIDHESGRSYGIFFFDYNSNHRIENNVVMGARHALVFEGGGSGVVMAHNASVAPRNNDTGAYATITEDQDTHGCHPYMNLFEGNVVSRIVRDSTWGSSSCNLNFRDWSRGYSENYADSLPVFGRIAVYIMADNYYNSIVGCVLGRANESTIIYPVGYGYSDYSLGLKSNDGATGLDALVATTTYLHGNYSFKTGLTTWDLTNLDHSLPNSMYLSGKPGWWDTGQWPGNGPDLVTKNGANPAYRRYLAYVADGSKDYSILSPASSASSDTTPPTAPTGLTGVATSASKIDLSWNASTDNVSVSGYGVFRDGILVSSTAYTNYSDAGLAAGSYTYTVKAYDAAGNVSPASSAASVSLQTSNNSSSSGSSSSGSSSSGVDTPVAAKSASAGGGGGGAPGEFFLVSLALLFALRTVRNKKTS